MNDEWETPDALYLALDDEFHFDLDAAADDYNFKHPNYLGHWEDNDAFDIAWHLVGKTVWLNPPYSRKKIRAFMKKAMEESENGCTVVALVRDDPSASWYQRFVDGKAKEVRRLVRRIKFVGAESAYNFPVCVVVYKPNEDQSVIDTDYYLWDWKW
ncbi:MAG: adenine methyltransferase [Armatimonadia bacterium]|nr:adenine methyltransferase [Armatimonadia bacterium]